MRGGGVEGMGGDCCRVLLERSRLEAANDAHQHCAVVVRDDNVLRRAPFILRLICSVAIKRAAYCPG